MIITITIGDQTFSFELKPTDSSTAECPLCAWCKAFAAPEPEPLSEEELKRRHDIMKSKGW